MRLNTSEIASGKASDVGWLASRGMHLSPKWHWLRERPWAAAILDRLTTTRPTFNGHNASAWKRDVLRVNGFDERMGYGGMDREMGERLENLGVRGLQIRHRAVCIHLDHDRDYVSAEAIRKNQAIRRSTRHFGSTRTPYGVVQDTEHGQMSRHTVSAAA